MRGDYIKYSPYMILPTVYDTSHRVRKKISLRRRKGENRDLFAIPALPQCETTHLVENGNLGFQFTSRKRTLYPLVAE